jgi:hypothetical protein
MANASIWAPTAARRRQASPHEQLTRWPTEAMIQTRRTSGGFSLVLRSALLRRVAKAGTIPNCGGNPQSHKIFKILNLSCLPSEAGSFVALAKKDSEGWSAAEWILNKHKLTKS